MTYTKPFKDLNKDNADIAGGKGASLGEMTQAGIPVPNGFVVLADTFEKFIKNTDLIQEIDTILSKVDHKAMHSVGDASEKIQELIEGAQMPQDIADEILSSFNILNTEFVAVRSSATAEDGQDHAWAGQLDSYLNIIKENVLEKVQQCWASLFTPRAIFYRFEKGLDTTRISVAVVVQKMVNSEVSGIAFSVHPVTEDRNQLIIEAGFGLGEAIVSGQITPDSYVVKKEPRNILDIKVSEQSRGLFRKEGGDNEWRELGVQGTTQVLNESQINELSNIILTIENHYEFPCDIEWAFEAGKFYIVQSRPITTLSSSSSLEDVMTHVWTKILTRKNSVFMDYMKLYASAKISNNLGYDYRIKNYKIVNGDNYVAEDYGSLVESLKKHLAVNPDVLFEIIDKAHNDIANYRKVWQRIQKSDTKSFSNKELIKLFDEYLQTLYGLMAYLFLPLSAEKILTEKIQSILKSYVSDDQVPALLQIIAIPARRSLVLEEQVEFLTLAGKQDSKSFDKSIFEEHLSKWAWLGDHFFWGAFWTLEDLILRFSDCVQKDCAQEIKQIIEIENTQKTYAEAMCKDLNLSKEDVEMIHLAQEYVHFRTYRLDMLFYSQFLVKNMLDEIAGRLGFSYQDLVLLAPQEIIDSLKNALDARDIIDQRKKSYAIVIQDYIVRVYSGNEVDQFQEYIKVDSKTVEGTVAYPGKVRGKVRVILTKSDFNKLQEGDILVTHMTTPDFVPLIKKCTAIITDEGGITCHAAIISRELRKPCIIGTKNATQILIDDNMVEVDAQKGMVTILK